jgi:glycosyltransferase involved in cell wall biosynthesis
VAEVVRPATGGIRRHVSDLLEHLDRRKFLPILYAPTDFLPDRPLPDVSRHAVEIGAATRPLSDYAAANSLAQLLHKNIDIVHAHGLRGAIVGGFAAQRARIPYLFTVHNLLPRMNAVQSAVLRSLAKHAVRIVVVSEAIAHTLRQTGIDNAKIALIPNGVDLSRFADPVDTNSIRTDLGIGSEDQIVLAVGRLSPEKGMDVLVEAFVALQARLAGIHLVIVGDGEEAPRLKALAERVANRIHFVGYRSDTVPLYAASDLVVAPSRQEGQGIVPLEAMAAGKTVVASRVGGLAETIVEGVTGLLIPPDDASALCGTMETLLNDPKRRAAMGAAGRRRVEQEYSLQNQIQKIEAIYSDVYRRTA